MKNERGKLLLPRGPQTDGAAKYSPCKQNPQSEGQTPGQGIVPEPAIDGFLDQVWECKVGLVREMAARSGLGSSSGSRPESLWLETVFLAVCVCWGHLLRVLKTCGHFSQCHVSDGEA